MKYFYQFQIWKETSQNLNGQFPWRYCTRYTIESAKEYENRSLNYIASYIVLAERVMMFTGTRITHVVVMELRNGKYFDAGTQTHTLLDLNHFTQLTPDYVTGARPSGHTDAFMGLNWRKNSQIGEQFQGYFPDCVGIDDVMNLPARSTEKRALVTNTKGPLRKHCWRFYAQTLAYLPQIQERVTSDRFGAMRLHTLQTSGRMFGFVSDRSDKRTRIARRGPKTLYVEGLLRLATDHMKQGLLDYNMGMQNFNHLWGDGQWPGGGTHNYQLRTAASVWAPLTEAFGYSPTTQRYGSRATDIDQGAGWDTATNGHIKVKYHFRQVHDCLMTLFNCHQWLLYLTHRPANAEQWQQDEYFWRGQYITSAQDWADWLYQDWNFLTELLFKVCDCINVLNSILMIDEPKTALAPGQQVNRPHFYEYEVASESAPPAVGVMPYINIYPIDPNPYLTTPSTESPPEPDEMPAPEEDIPFDSGPGYDDPDDENYQSALQEAVRTALGKLEFMRKWVLRIARYAPSSRVFPIIDTGPINDQTINPFDGTPIEPPKIKP